MIVNLKSNLLEFIKSHNLPVMDIEYVSYLSKEHDSYCCCDFSELVDIAEDINFEDYDPLIKHREQLSQDINIVADEWYITRSTDPAAIWEYHQLPPTGEYNEISEEDIIDTDDVIDLDVVELLTHDSPNLDYVRDSITILDKEYRIENNDGIEQVINDKNEVGIILACNPHGQYWTQPYAGIKDPQMLFHPELVKIIMEYQSTLEPLKGYNLRDADIGSVLDLEELASNYNLNTGGFDESGFNNLEVVFVRSECEYQITYTGGVNFPELRHEIITRVTPNSIIKL